MIGGMGRVRTGAARVWWAPLGLALACETAPAPPPPPPTYADPAPEQAAGQPGVERAWRHLEALTAIGSRVTGSEGAARAREYITAQLSGLGLEVEERIDAGQEETLPEGVLGPEALRPRNLLARIPGQSADLVVLVAPYDSRPFETFEFVGANDGASGAAVLLALAAELVETPLFYTTWLVFLDGEARLRDTGSGPAGSQLEARRFYLDGTVAHVRLLVSLNRVCDPDLRIARDLMSHRIYREEFWSAAARLGHTDVFDPAQHFESPWGSHLPFRSVGLRRITGIADTRFGGDEPPGLYADSEDDTLDHCAAHSLSVVGEVTEEALRTISRRLAKIDRFSSSPLSELDPLAAPGLEPAIAEGEAEAESAAGSAPATDPWADAIPPPDAPAPPPGDAPAP